jgi:hypothetical protein
LEDGNETGELVFRETVDSSATRDFVFRFLASGLGFGAEGFGFDVVEDLEEVVFGDLRLETGFGFEIFLAFEDADDFEVPAIVDFEREGGRMFFAQGGKHHSVNFEFST